MTDVGGGGPPDPAEPDAPQRRTPKKPKRSVAPSVGNDVLGSEVDPTMSAIGASASSDAQLAAGGGGAESQALFRSEPDLNLAAHRRLRIFAFWMGGGMSFAFLVLLFSVLCKFFFGDTLIEVVATSKNSNWHALVLDRKSVV